MDGKLVMEKPLQIGENELFINLNSGIYLLELNGDTSRAIKKLIIK